MTANFNAKTKDSRPRYTKEEYAIHKQEEKEQVYQTIDEMLDLISKNPDQLQAYLDTQARMDRYSTANTLLIMKQCPEATQLKDYNDWADSKVQIKEGAKAISILEPVEYTRQNGTQGISYNVKKVFDVSQTTSRRMPAPTVVHDPTRIVAAMLDTSNVKYEIVENFSTPNTLAHYDNDKATLYVKEGVGMEYGVSLFQQLAREMSYAEIALNSDAFDRKDASMAAGCSTYMLCKKYGVDTRAISVGIPEKWDSMEHSEIRAELSKARQAMSNIHQNVYEELNRQRQDREQDISR